MTSHRCLGMLLLALLVPASTAVAAPEVANPAAAPADTAAGAHSDFTVSFDVAGLGAVGAGGDDLKRLQLDLPPGLVGNPLATGPVCTTEQFTADACPAGTRVGTTVTTARLNDLLPGTEIAGDIYNVTAAAGEAARLGIVLRPVGGLLPKVFLQSSVSLRQSDGGLTSTVEDIPATAGGMELRIDRMALTLLGTLPSGKAFMTNPTSCAAAPTAIAIATYGGQSAAGTATFTPTACEALPFAPQISATIGATRDDVRLGAQPAVDVAVTQAEGEANARSVSVTLPGGLGSSFAALGNACPVETYDAGGACPPASVLGRATAESPLLATPLTGPVTFVTDPVGGLPQLRVALRGAFPVNLVGRVGFDAATGRVTNTFDGIFDVPLSRFLLHLDAGPTSPVKVSGDLCVPGRSTLDGTFVAHSGKQATATATAELPRCGDIRPSTLGARLRKRVLRLAVENADRPVQSLSFRLPKGVRFTARAKRRTRVTTSATGVKAKVGLRKGRMTVTLPGNGAAKVEVTLRRGALRVGRRAKRRMGVVVKLVGVAPERSTVKLRR